MALAPQSIIDKLSEINKISHDRDGDLEIHISELRSLLRNNGDDDLEKATLLLLEAMLGRVRNEQQMAYDTGQKCLDILIEKHFTGQIVSIAWNLMGLVSSNLNKQERAIQCFELALAPDDIPLSLELVVLQNLGTSQKQFHQMQDALETFTEALAIAENNEMGEIAAGLALNLASVYFILSDANRCLHYLDVCSEYNEKHPDKHLLQYLHINRAFMFRYFGRVRDSRQSIDILIDNFDSMGFEILRIGVVSQVLLFAVATVDAALFEKGMEMAKDISKGAIENIENNSGWQHMIIECLSGLCAVENPHTAAELCTLVHQRFRLSITMRPKTTILATLVLLTMRCHRYDEARELLHDLRVVARGKNVSAYASYVIRFCELVLSNDTKDEVNRHFRDLMSEILSVNNPGMYWFILSCSHEFAAKGLTLSRDETIAAISAMVDNDQRSDLAILWSRTEYKEYIEHLNLGIDWAATTESLNDLQRQLHVLAEATANRIVM